MRIFLQGDSRMDVGRHKGIDPEQSLRRTTNSRSYNLRNHFFRI